MVSGGRKGGGVAGEPPAKGEPDCNKIGHLPNCRVRNYLNPELDRRSIKSCWCFASTDFYLFFRGIVMDRVEEQEAESARWQSQSANESQSEVVQFAPGHCPKAHG